MNKLVEQTLPGLVKENMICKGADVFLPHLEFTHNEVERKRTFLENYFVITYVKDRMLSPLYAATEQVTAQLLEFKHNPLTNCDQMKWIDEFSSLPWIRLTSIGIEARGE